MITMSALPRLINCPSSAALPRADNHSIWAELGNDNHETLAELDDPDHEFARLIPPGSRAEVRVAYDVVSRAGRIIGVGGGREYGSLGPFEIAGSIDVLGQVGDVVVVIDWKSGFREVDAASRNHQLWGYALAACRALGCDSAKVMIVYTQSGAIDEYTIDALELAEFANRLERLHTQVSSRIAARVRGEQLDTNEGGWCRHCPSKHACPSKNALLVQFSEHGLAIIGDATMTAERAVSAYEQLTRIEQLTSDARKRLQTYVDDNGPIDLGDGKRYGRYVRRGNERLDGAVAVTAIRELVESAKEFESVAIERKTSKAAIERAAKQVGTKGLATKIVKRIRELGGSTTASDTMPYGEYNADKDEPAPREEIDHDAVNALLAAHP